MSADSDLEWDRPICWNRGVGGADGSGRQERKASVPLVGFPIARGGGEEEEGESYNLHKQQLECVKRTRTFKSTRLLFVNNMFDGMPESRFPQM